MSCVVGGRLKLDLVAHDVGGHLLAGLHLGRHNHVQLYRGMQKKTVFIIVTFEHLADVESFHFLVQALP